MSNNNEIDELINKSFDYPLGLESVEQRLEERIRREKRRKKTTAAFFSTAAALMFIVLINTSVAFAGIVAEIPLLGRIAEYVKFDRSLASTIENDYIQKTGLISIDGQEKLLLPYVIADEKNLVLFFQLPDNFSLSENQWAGISLIDMTDGSTGEKIEGFGYSSSNISAEGIRKDGTIILQNYHFSEGSLPQSVNINVSLKKETYDNEEGEKDENISSDTIDMPEVQSVGNFSFSIKFNEFAKPVNYVFNQEHMILGQKIILKEMNVYPTGTEVLFEFSKDNAAWVKGLELALEENGVERFRGKDGISATHDESNTWMKVYIQSDYFEKPKEQQLVIKGIRLIDKEEEFLSVDLDKMKMTPEVEGIKLVKAEKNGGSVSLVFESRTLKGDTFGMFNHEYTDSEGNVYGLWSEGSSTAGDTMQTSITVEYPNSGIVILKRDLSVKNMLDEPIRVSLPAQ
ncbi:MAG: DUF4179 domain-containing protein [Sedimentibacter sp.]|uniref:DUF4179 domain-containing protein n=1 Tax=Sedimentibacter sp. TaxID=1960295 RepID=UPI0031580AA5